MKCFIALSKFGDIIQSLGIIHHHWKKTGKKPDVITSDKFSEIFQGVSYVRKVIIFPGKWSDLHGAIKFAKGIYNDVTILQCHGENFPFKQTKPSFQHEVYDRVGMLGQWAVMKPNFDRRDFGREKSLLDGHGLLEKTKSKYICIGTNQESGKVISEDEIEIEIQKPFILLADHSESSPFKQIEELKVMLNTKFSDRCKVVLLSQIKAQKIFDLLGIYERAEALITTETVHTHLAWATNVPMFVLSADGWRGSAFRREFGFYAKYAEWNKRKNDLMDALENHLEKKQLRKVTVFKTEKPFGYNLSSEIMRDGEPVYTYRYHEGGWKTKLMICVDGKQFPLRVDESIDNFSHEDCRLWVMDGKLFGVYTVAAEVQGYWKCYQAYGEITNEVGEWKIGHIQIKYPGNDFTGTNKNFVPFVVDGTLHFIYGVQGANQVALEMDFDRVRKVHHSPAPKWGHGEIRGGIVILSGDALLRFFHSRAEYPDKTFSYFVGCAIMENKPPFKTLSICKAPVLSGDEEFIPNCKHYKSKVCFPLGAIQQGDKILLSYGHNDCECRIAELNHSDLHL